MPSAARRRRELAAGAGHHHLVHPAVPGELAGKQPDLALSAAPFPAGRDVHYPDVTNPALPPPQRCRRPCRRRRTSPARHVGQQGSQLGETERLVEVGAIEGLEEREGVTAHRVAGAEDQPAGHRRVAPGDLLVELAPAESRHPEVRDDQIEAVVLQQRQALDAITRDHGDVSPRLECRAHVVEDVRLVVDHEHAEAAWGDVLAGVGGRGATGSVASGSCTVKIDPRPSSVVRRILPRARARCPG